MNRATLKGKEFPVTKGVQVFDRFIQHSAFLYQILTLATQVNEIVMVPSLIQPRVGPGGLVRCTEGTQTCTQEGPVKFFLISRN